MHDFEALTGKILPFLLEADKQSEKVVVHCSGGVGRTGLVLAAWLVYVGAGSLTKQQLQQSSKQVEILMKQQLQQFS